MDNGVRSIFDDMDQRCKLNGYVKPYLSGVHIGKAGEITLYAYTHMKLANYQQKQTAGKIHVSQYI